MEKKRSRERKTESKKNWRKIARCMVEIIYGAQNENHENVIKVQSTHTATERDAAQCERETMRVRREMDKNVNANAKVNCWQSS